MFLSSRLKYKNINDLKNNIYMLYFLVYKTELVINDKSVFISIKLRKIIWYNEGEKFYSYKNKNIMYSSFLSE